LHYTRAGRWHITLRLGPALFRKDFVDAAQLLSLVERCVHDLSGPEIAPVSMSQ
jgi:hypothetical protein